MKMLTVFAVFLVIPALAGARQLSPAHSPDGDSNPAVVENRVQSPGASSAGPAFWLDFGLGPGSIGGIMGISISYRNGGMILTGRTFTDFELFGDHMWDAGALYGRATEDGSFFASAAAGLAVVGGSRSEGLFSPVEEISTTLGIPVELQVGWHPVRFAGLGLKALGNFNLERSFGGVALTVKLGKLR